MLWPLTFALGSHIAGWRDAQYYTWASWKAGELIASGDLALRLRDIVWPYGIDLRLIDGHLPTLIGGLWNLVAGPELAQNLTLLSGTGLNLWAGRRLGKAFSGDRAVWVLTAIAFATAPAIAARLEVHLPMYFAFPVALLVEEAVRVARGDHAIRPLRLGVILFVAFLCGIYFLIFGSIAFALLVLLAASPRGLPRILLRAAMGIAVVVVLMSPFLAARLAIDRAESVDGRSLVPLENTLRAEADGLSILSQPSSATVDLPGMARLREHFRPLIHESTIFPGFLLLGGIAACLFLRSPLRWPLLFTSLIVWLLALGTSPKLDGRFLVQTGDPAQPVVFLPYTALVHVPGLAGLRSPNRAGFTLAAILVAATAQGLAWLFATHRGRLRHAAFAGIAGALLLPNLLIPIHVLDVASPSLRRALLAVANRVEPGDSMLEVPGDCPGQTHDVVYQILHRTPLIGCQTSTQVIPWRSDLELYGSSAAFAALRCDPGSIGRKPTPFTRAERFEPADAAALREEMGVRFYLIDLRAAARCERVAEAARILRSSFEVLGRDDRWVVVDAGPAAPSAA
jgi:hypothetical protein